MDRKNLRYLINEQFAGMAKSGTFSKMESRAHPELRKILKQDYSNNTLEESSATSEMSQFSRSPSGRKVASAGNKIHSAGGAIYKIAEDQTGLMADTLYNISEFVEKLGGTLSSIGSLEEGTSVVEGLPTVQELKSLQKAIQRLEK